MVVQKVKSVSDTSLRPGAQIMISSSGEAFIKTFTELIERLTKKMGRKGVLISTQWSANALSRRISLSKLPKKSVKVIDTISLSMGSKLPATDDFAFLSTPVSLESILMEIERTFRGSNGEYTFLLLDSLTHLNRYYTEGQINEFFHFLLSRMLEEQCLVILFDQEPPGSSRISDQLSNMIDQTLQLMPGGDRK
ncbi:MAG: hypothetical protein ACMUHM_00630 [Thermoplasmatota archaeon]